MIDGYQTSIVESSKTLSAIEKFRVQDMSDAVRLDKATEDGPISLDFDYFAIVHVVNPKAKNDTEYDKLVIVDKSGVMYTSSSETLMAQLRFTLDCMNDSGEKWMLVILQKPSANQQQNFLTCTVQAFTVLTDGTNTIG